MKQGWAETLSVKICKACTLLLWALCILWGFVNFCFALQPICIYEGGLASG